MTRPVTPSPMTRMDSLSGVRFFAATLVAVLHAGLLFDVYPDGYSLVRQSGEGIAAFFLLSGFVMAWSFRPQDRPRDFWQRRLAKIYPAYILAWVLAVGANLLTDRGIGGGDALSLVLLQSWVPVSDVYFATSGVFWSLSVEAFFYLLFPFIIRPLARLSERGRMVCIGAVLMAGVCTTTAGQLIGGEAGTWFHLVFPPVRALDFVLGILLALQLRHRLIPVPPLPVAAALALVSFAGIGFVPESAFVPFSICLVPMAYLLLAAASADLTGRPSLFRHPVIAQLGVWSYSLYLVHMTVMIVYIAVVSTTTSFDTSTLGWMGRLLHLGLMFTLSIGVSVILYYTVEKPLNARLRPRRRALPVLPPEAAQPTHPQNLNRHH
ncbi:acyltransferase family protein [Citricoccus nitrophenolicus]|uniref:acyltransferase family protein n=1 Tax=Citricoccus nitrophenolicus TaxID=863575 RepID=UPI0031ECEF71